MFLLHWLLRTRRQHVKGLNKYYIVTVREPEESLIRNDHFLLEDDLYFITGSSFNKMKDLLASSKFTTIGSMGMLCVLLVSLTQRTEYTT
jgi:hypothetical protein